MTLSVTKTSISFLPILLVLFVSACSGASPTTVPQSNTDFMFPNDVIEFHIRNQKVPKVFVLTNYQNPYPGHFQYIRLNGNNRFELVNSKSRVSLKGLISGEVTTAEREIINEVIASIQRTSSAVPQEGESILL